MRYVMVIDSNRCVGCQACTIACKQKNGTPPNVFFTRVLISETGTFPDTRITYKPILCMQCENPACEKVCPTGATQKLENGVVIIDAEKCIGCRYCMAACPYNARFFNYGHAKEYFPEKGATPFEVVHQSEHTKGVVEKCNFCLDRVEVGDLPLCVQTCPGKARYFGNIDDPSSEVARLIAARGGVSLLAELGTNPSVYYLPG
jgi:dimethyl sulfoxide reductase iron-sulfur subunit